MSASQPLKVFSIVGPVISSDATRVTGDRYIVRTGLLHASAVSSKDGGLVGVCNTTTSNVGVTSIHVNKSDDVLLRYAHPKQAKITGITTGAQTTLIVDDQDTKFNVEDRITILGSSVGIYNTTLQHVQVVSVIGSQLSNNYQTKIVVDVDTSSGHAAFTGVATAYKSVIPVLKPESSNGCEAYFAEVQLA